VAKHDGMQIPVLTPIAHHSFWQRGGLLIARLIIAAVFAMACFFKFKDIGATADYIAAAGFPMGVELAWVAAICELVLVIAFLTGILMREAALLGAIYVLFLAFAFHGPQTWEGDVNKFGFFMDHFTFTAGLLYMTAFGPGPLGIRR
jgi:putative oxidoreductase